MDCACKLLILSALLLGQTVVAQLAVRPDGSPLPLCDVATCPTAGSDADESMFADSHIASPLQPTRKGVLPRSIAPIVTSLTNFVTIIDAMVVYTPEARISAGGATALHNAIDLAVAEANTVYQNSRAHIRLRLVHRSELNYVEHPALSTNLHRLQAKNDGFIDEVHALRETNRADVVCLITENGDPGLSGLAFTMGEPSLGFSAFAFCVIKRAELVGSYMFAHEIGHIMGCQHDRENSLDELGALKPGAFPYSHAHRFTVNGVQYRTVMAHEPGQPIPFFSNPDLLFQGVPLGLPGTTNGANNTLTLNNTALLVASFMGLAVQTAPPAVVIDTPAEAAVFRAGTNVTAAISTSDRDGRIAQVELYVGNQLIGLSTTAIRTNIVLGPTTNTLPLTNLTYSITWSNVPPGEFKLTARSVDNVGASSASLATTIIVRPKNDNFVDRIVLTNAEPVVIGTNLAATLEPGEPVHAGNAGGSSVWYSWTAPRTSSMVVRTIGSGILPLTEIYRSLTSTTSTTVSREFEFDKTNLVARTTFDAVAGEVYSIAVDAAGGKGGTFTLEIFVQPPPANDNFENRELIAGDSIRFTANNAYATTETNEPQHAAPNASGKSIWYSWTAPRDTTAVVTVRGDGFFPLADVYTNAPLNQLKIVAGRTISFNQTNKTTFLTFNVAQGQQYALAIAGFAADGGEFEFTLQLPSPPPNDNFADRILLSGTSITLETANRYATAEKSEPVHPQLAGGRSIWYAWTAPVSGPVSITARGDSFYPFALVYTGGALNLLTNVPSAAIKFDTNLVSTLTFSAVAFRHYILGLDGFNGHSGNILLTLTTANSPPSLKSYGRDTTSSQFKLSINGSLGQKFAVHASTNLIQWSEISRATFLSETVEFRDESSSTLRHRFYQVFPVP